MRWLFLVLAFFAARPAVGQEPATAAEVPSFEPVTWERLLTASDEPQNWLMYSGTFDGQRYSRLKQINEHNVPQLELKWAYQIPSVDISETTPLVVDGVMFITEPSNSLVALDAATGREFWRYEYDLPNDLRLCCGPHNRGVAIRDQTLYMSTLDAHLLAIDAINGELLWDTEVADHRTGHSITAAPLVVKDQILTGIAGADFGVRGFLDSYDAQTGNRTWRIYTIPGPDHPDNQSWSGDSWRTGGAPTWLTGSYDPDLDLVYWGTGNPAPSYYGDIRSGDNLYSDSALALDPDTGELAWHFQFTPHDVHQWDANQIPVLADVDIAGTSRRTMLWANRNGFYYALDRATGQFLLGAQFALQTWAQSLDESGRPILAPGMRPSDERAVVSPPAAGATNWMSPAYSPSNESLYVMSFDGAGQFIRGDDYLRAEPYTGGRQWIQGDPGSISAVRAIDARTGDRRWQYPRPAADLGWAARHRGRPRL